MQNKIDVERDKAALKNVLEAYEICEQCEFNDFSLMLLSSAYVNLINVDRVRTILIDTIELVEKFN